MGAGGGRGLDFVDGVLDGKVWWGGRRGGGRLGFGVGCGGEGRGVERKMRIVGFEYFGGICWI